MYQNSFIKWNGYTLLIIGKIEYVLYEKSLSHLKFSVNSKTILNNEVYFKKIKDGYSCEMDFRKLSPINALLRGFNLYENNTVFS